MSVTFAIEPLAPIWPQFMGLAMQHWQETEGYRAGQQFAPDAYRYFQYNEMGMYVFFTVRDGPRLVGYAGIYFTPSMHTQRLIATEDCWFLLPEYRKGRNALNLHRFVEDECRRRGVVEIGMTAKLTNSVGRILEYLGYKEVSKQYSKHLAYNHESPEAGIALTDGRADSTDTATVKELSDVCTVAATGP